jgi:hypothetical protein
MTRPVTLRDLIRAQSAALKSVRPPCAVAGCPNREGEVCAFSACPGRRRAREITGEH